MEDLRNDEQIKKDEKNWSKNSVQTFTGHLPTIWQIIKIFFMKTFKVWVGVVLIILTLMYPNEIGSFIGNWTYEFWTGLTNKF
jgi:hypothetical protein